LPARPRASADAAQWFEALAVRMPLLRDFGDEGIGRAARAEVGCEEQDRGREERDPQNGEEGHAPALGGFFRNRGLSRAGFWGNSVSWWAVGHLICMLRASDGAVS